MILRRDDENLNIFRCLVFMILHTHLFQVSWAQKKTCQKLWEKYSRLATRTYMILGDLPWWLLKTLGYAHVKSQRWDQRPAQNGYKWHTSERPLKSLWRVRFVSLERKDYKLCEVSIKSVRYYKAVLPMDLRWLRKQSLENSTNVILILSPIFFFPSSLDPGAA